jgi:hypothetical protein
LGIVGGYEFYPSTAGIAPHFRLWRHFFKIEKTRGFGVIGGVGFILCRYKKYVDLVLPDNTTGWKQGWFYLDNPTPALLGSTRRAFVPYPECTNQLTLRETEKLHPLLDDLERLKAEWLTGGAVAISFNCQLIQPIQDRVHLAFESPGS